MTLKLLVWPGPGQAVAGLVLAVFGGRAGVNRLECGRGSCGSSTARPPEERGGPLARPAGQSEREAKRKALTPSSRAEGLLFLHGLESNPGSSLQTEEEAGLP